MQANLTHEPKHCPNSDESLRGSSRHVQGRIFGDFCVLWNKNKNMIVFLTAQNDNIVLIGFQTRDFVKGSLARIESSQQKTLPHEAYVCHPATDEPPDQLVDANRV